MNWDVVSDYYPLYQEAFLLTMFIAFWGILGSIAVGFLVSLIRFYKIPVLKPLATAYIEFSRNTPLLLQLFFLYFGLPRVGLVLSSEACATIGLIFLGGSYMAESFRSGLEAVKRRGKSDSLSAYDQYKSSTMSSCLRLQLLPCLPLVPMSSF